VVKAIIIELNKMNEMPGTVFETVLGITGN